MELNLQKLIEVYEFARNAHSKQKRKTGEPYITHPVAVAEIARQHKADGATIYACLLHDVVEDTPISLDEITEMFGQEIAFLVDGVTKVDENGLTSMEKTDRKILEYAKKDRRVALIKLSDRLHNLQNPFESDDFQISQKWKKKYLGYVEWYKNLAMNFGYHEFVPELEEAINKLTKRS